MTTIVFSIINFLENINNIDGTREAFYCPLFHIWNKWVCYSSQFWRLYSTKCGHFCKKWSNYSFCHLFSALIGKSCPSTSAFPTPLINLIYVFTGYHLNVIVNHEERSEVLFYSTTPFQDYFFIENSLEQPFFFIKNLSTLFKVPREKQEICICSFRSIISMRIS